MSWLDAMFGGRDYGSICDRIGHWFRYIQHPRGMTAFCQRCGHTVEIRATQTDRTTT